jgi:hypothetical protein
VEGINSDYCDVGFSLERRRNSMTTFANRILLAAKLNANVYEEVEGDPAAMSQAMAVVVLSSVAAGIGSTQGGVAGIFLGTIMALVGWFVWSYLTYLIGTRLLPGPQTRANYGELLRTIGFSSAPGMIRILGIIPGLMTITFVVSGIWMLIAMVVAVRQALDYRTSWRAVGVCLIGWVIQAALMAIVFALFGAPKTGT